MALRCLLLLMVGSVFAATRAQTCMVPDLPVISGTTNRAEADTLYLFTFDGCIGQTATEYEYCYHFVDTSGQEIVFDLLVLEDLGEIYSVILRIDGAGIGAPNVGQCPNRDSSGNCCERVNMNNEAGLPLTVTVAANHLYGLLIGSDVANRLLLLGSTSPGYKVSSPTDHQLDEGDTVSKEDLGTDGEPEQLSDISFRFIVQPVESLGTTSIVTATPDTTPEASQQISQAPDASQQISQTPEASQQISPMPQASQQISQTPQASQQNMQTPEASQQISQMPQASQQIPQLSQPSSRPSNTPGMEAGGGGPKSGGADGGIVAAAVIVPLLVISLAVAVTVIVIFLMVRYRRTKSVDIQSKPKGFENALYAVPEETPLKSIDTHEYEQQDGYEPHDYAVPDQQTYSKEEAYAKPEPSPYIYPVHTFQKNEVSEEDIYMVPASDEHSLYDQIKRINIAQIQRNAVTTTDHLGSGQYGTVKRGVWQSPNGPVDVAVKMLKSSSGQDDKVKFLQEATIMGQFLHPNTVKLFGVVISGEPKMMVLELLAKGDLQQHLISTRPENGGTISEEFPHTLLSYCRQIASGMNYLSNKAFIHRDLAARNILVSEDAGTCKIADFGMSRDLMDESYYVAHGGKIPVKWTSPEALNFKKYSTASDVWSYGMVLYEIWSLGHKPFEVYTNSQAMSMLDGGIRLPPPPGCPRAIYELMIKCWHPVASQRPDFATIVQSLSRSDPELLKWSEEDKTAHPEATVLGAELNISVEMFKELQNTYYN